jgi:UDP-galactopyranose mutase
MFIEGYTQKQWGRHPSELPASIVKRIPVRLTFDDNYFDHPYQGIPIGGYTALVRAIIPTDAAIYYDTPFEERMVRSYDAVIYTGAIDRYFDYALGPLEYRSLRFDNALYESDDHQGCAVMNYTDAAVPHTRVIEHRHFDPKARPTGFTYVTKETPVEWTPGLERFYPVPTERNQALYERYAALDRDPRVVFGGRLGTYRYMDMDKTIRAAMDKAQEILAA